MTADQKAQDKERERSRKERAAGEATIPPGFAFTTLGDALKSFGRNEQVIEGHLPSHGVTFVVARRSDGKTLTVLDLGLCLATDRDWLVYATERGRTFVYCCGEDLEGALQNLHALYQREGMDPDDKTPRFIFIPAVPNLLDEYETKAFINSVRKLLPAGAKPVIAIDTWQRATKDAPMNDDVAMQKGMHNAELIGRELNCPVLIPAHPPKGSNNLSVAGSSVVENGSVALWYMKKPERAPKGKQWGKLDREIRVDRIKGPGFDTVSFVRITKRKILDKDGNELKDNLGRPLTGAVLTPIEGPTETADDNADKSNDVLALEALRKFGQTGATWTEWLKATKFMDPETGKLKQMPKSSFNEARGKLEAAKDVTLFDGKYVAVSELPDEPTRRFGPGPAVDLDQVPPAGHA